MELEQSAETTYRPARTHRETFPLTAHSLGDTWLVLLGQVLRHGKTVDDFSEVLDLAFQVPRMTLPDTIIDRLGEEAQITEMRKVFHTAEPNRFGHSYRQLMAGPMPGDAIRSVVAMLASKRSTRQAVITLGNSGSHVPCVNVIQFMIRDERLAVSYFARGQDLFNKFYADAICIFDLARQVADSLQLESVSLGGTIGSAHIYLRDRSRALDVLRSAEKGA